METQLPQGLIALLSMPEMQQMIQQQQQGPLQMGNPQNSGMPGQAQAPMMNIQQAQAPALPGADRYSSGDTYGAGAGGGADGKSGAGMGGGKSGGGGSGSGGAGMMNGFF